MLMAQLRGKLPSEVWTNSEDLLTSAVFGTLKNLAAGVTTALLSNVVPLQGADRPRLVAPLTWNFWPWWDTCEPDVTVEDPANLVVLEAKLYSDFGDGPEGGRQLIREWRDGARRAVANGKQLWLLAVTNHSVPPVLALRRQLADSGADLSRVGWIGWSEIARYLQSPQGADAYGWRDDLLDVLTALGLAPFSGFGEAVEASGGLPRDSWSVDLAMDQVPRLPVGFGPVAALASRLATRHAQAWSFRTAE